RRRLAGGVRADGGDLAPAHGLILFRHWNFYAAHALVVGIPTPSATGLHVMVEKKTPRLATPTDLGSNASKDIAGALNAVLADTFALFMKTKNFHWHVSGPHFRDYHLLFDEQAAEILGSTDEIAERVRKVGGNTLRSIGDIARHQRLEDNDA